MGFWNNIGSVFGSINTPNVENDTTYQRYQKEIKNFNLDTPSKPNYSAQPNHSIKKDNEFDELDDIETLDDVKHYFSQKENKE